MPLSFYSFYQVIFVSFYEFQHNNTALMLACSGGQQEVACYLATQGARIDIKNNVRYRGYNRMTLNNGYNLIHHVSFVHTG